MKPVQHIGTDSPKIGTTSQRHLVEASNTIKQAAVTQANETPLALSP